jgi:hypothetical protein
MRSKYEGYRHDCQPVMQFFDKNHVGRANGAQPAWFFVGGYSAFGGFEGFGEAKPLQDSLFSITPNLPGTLTA